MPTRTPGLDWGIAANQIAASAGHHSSARSTLMPNRDRVDRGVTRRSGCGICTNTWYPRPLPRKRAIRVFLQVGSLTCEPARAVVTGEVRPCGRRVRLGSGGGHDCLGHGAAVHSGFAVGRVE